MGASKSQSQPAQSQKNIEPSGADKFFASADHHMVGGRAGVDVAAGGLGAAPKASREFTATAPAPQAPAPAIQSSDLFDMLSGPSPAAQQQAPTQNAFSFLNGGPS